MFHPSAHFGSAVHFGLITKAHWYNADRNNIVRFFCTVATANPVTSPITKTLEEPLRLTPAKVANILWASAVDAFVKAIILLVMGNIALGLIGAIFKEMAPSAPPFLAGHSNPQTDSNSSSVLHRSWASIREHEFLIIFAVFFVLCARTRLASAGFGIAGQTQITETRFQKLSGQVSKDWFRLFVGNAFGALVSAVVIYFVQSFTEGFLLKLLLAAVIPTLKTMAVFVFGSAVVNFVGGLFDWYGDNQLRFNFWILYLAAVCDDLGLPNVKTFARFLWSRWRRQKSASAS
jgi:hypothetical protein